MSRASSFSSGPGSEKNDSLIVKLLMKWGTVSISIVTNKEKKRDKLTGVIPDIRAAAELQWAEGLSCEESGVGQSEARVGWGWPMRGQHWWCRTRAIRADNPCILLNICHSRDLLSLATICPETRSKKTREYIPGEINNRCQPRWKQANKHEYRGNLCLILHLYEVTICSHRGSTNCYKVWRWFPDIMTSCSPGLHSHPMKFISNSSHMKIKIRFIALTFEPRTEVKQKFKLSFLQCNILRPLFKTYYHLQI